MHPSEESVQASRRSFKWSSLAIFTFWLAVIGLLFWISTAVLKPKPATVTASGDLVIPKARDGHYYAQGTVGGAPELALLGQNFLGRFDITLTGDMMTLRAK